MKAFIGMIFIFVVAGVTVSGSANSQESGCTPQSSPRQCYESGLAEVGKALAEFRSHEQALRTVIDSQAREIAKLREEFGKQFSTAAPAKLVGAFFLNECPAGWVPFEAGRGRYLVGLSSPGALGATVGEALLDLENRATGAHVHRFDYKTVSADRRAADYASGEIQPTLAHGTTASPDGAKAGTNAPYVQVLLCQKS